jgi:hypothetical protein
MKDRYIKRANGHWIKKGPGKLKLFLSEKVPSAAMPQRAYDLAAGRSSYDTSSPNPD